MNSVSLRQKVYFSFLVAALLLVATGYLYHRSSTHYVRTVLQVERTQRVLAQMETVLSLAKDAETGERGYVITRQERFLEPYNLALTNVQRELAALEKLAGAEPFHIPRLRQVRALIDAQTAFLSSDIDLVRAGKYEEAAARVASGEGKRLLDAIRRQVAEMQAQERSKLAVQLDEVEAQAQRNNVVNVVAIGVLVALFGAAAFTITRDLLRQEQQDRELTAKNQALAALSTNLQNLLDRLYEAQQTAQVGSFDLDETGDYFVATPELFRIYGWDPALAGQRTDVALFNDAVHPDDRERVLQEVYTSLAGPAPYSTQYRIVLPDGSIKHLLARGKPVREGEKVHSQGTVMDITERQRAEQQLQLLNHNLQVTNDELSAAVEELSAASRQIQQYSVALEQQNQDLEAFSYSVSHDLKTPLRSVLSFGGILEDEYAEVLDEEGRRLLDIVLSSARIMHELIEALLQFARMGRTAVQPEAVDMDRLVREQLAQVLSDTEHPPQLNIAPLGVARADRQLIRQVWFNLLSNAVKFSARQPAPRIRIGCKPIDGEIVYSVSDNGIGFDPQYAADLFGVFKRLHSADGFPGTGVGLALCQRILANHGGRIWAEGAEGHGATFYFTLPSIPSPA